MNTGKSWCRVRVELDYRLLFALGVLMLLNHLL
jgi:hypothetical protein